MADHAEQLSLSSELVEAKAALYTGRGYWLQSYQREEMDSDDVRDRIHFAASAFTIGASYYSLTDQWAARTVFGAAAHAYRAVGSLYGAVPALCARDDELLTDFRRNGRDRNPRTLEANELVAYALLAMSGTVADAPASSDVFEGMGLFEGLAVGNARLPFWLYLSLGRDPQRNAMRFFERWAERIFEARSQGSRWYDLTTRFLPVDAEILAAAILVVNGGYVALPEAHRRSTSERPLPLLPLIIATEMLQASAPQRPLVEDDVLAKLARRPEPAG